MIIKKSIFSPVCHWQIKILLWLLFLRVKNNLHSWGKIARFLRKEFLLVRGKSTYIAHVYELLILVSVKDLVWLKIVNRLMELLLGNYVRTMIEMHRLYHLKKKFSNLRVCHGANWTPATPRLIESVFWTKPLLSRFYGAFFCEILNAKFR